MKRLKTLVMTILLLGLPWASAQAGLVVVVAQHSSVDSLDRDEIARIFLKKLKVLPGGQALVPIRQLSTPTVDDTFYLNVCNKDRSQLSAYWARLMFTGKDRPPLDGQDDAGVLKLIEKTPNGIGFVDEASVTPAVKVVYRLP